MLSGLVVVVVAVVVCAVALGVVAASRPTTWTSSVTLLYSPDATTALLTGAGAQDSSDIDRTLATQSEVITGDAVMGKSAGLLGVSQQSLVDATAVEAVTGSNVLRVSVEGPSAGAAATRAQTVGEQYISYNREQSVTNLSGQAMSLQTAIGTLRAQLTSAQNGGSMANVTALRATLSDLLQQQFQLRAAADADQGDVRALSAATRPSSPSSIGTRTAVLIGAAVGLVLGVGLLLIAEWWRRPAGVDDRDRDSDDPVAVAVERPVVG